MTEYYWTPKRIKELKARGYKLHSSQDSLIKKDFREQAEKEKKELDDSYKESVRQTKERKALDKKKKV
tara:strand:+ start:370 stop:573 length:204 start_codon:yes stop_codon:yes gene_type:complete